VPGFWYTLLRLRTAATSSVETDISDRIVADQSGAVALAIVSSDPAARSLVNPSNSA